GGLGRGGGGGAGGRGGVQGGGGAAGVLAASQNRPPPPRRCLVGPRSSRQADQGQQRPVAGLENRAFSSSELSNVRRRLVWTKIGPFKAQTCVCARAVTQ